MYCELDSNVYGTDAPDSVWEQRISVGRNGESKGRKKKYLSSCKTNRKKLDLFFKKEKKKPKMCRLREYARDDTARTI